MRKFMTFFLGGVLCFTLEAVGDDHGPFGPEIERLLREQVIRVADSVLGQEPVTVTASRAARSAGGPHDFYSEGDYWWPDPEHPDGPYIRRDGMTNPDNFVAHREAMIRFSRIIGALASAYTLTGDDQYVRDALRHLNAWFVDTATRMSPHLLYAQAIKGRVTGRGIGIIDTIHLIEVAQGILAMQDAHAFDANTLAAVRRWFSAYLEWLTTHPYGQDEMNAKNNHGTCWVMQVAAFARLTGNEELMEFCRKRYKEVLLPDQMAEDGSFPLELERTKPYGYSLFNLDAMATICQLLSVPEDNLWEYTAPGGRSIKKGIEFMVPFLADKASWPYEPDVMYWNNWPVAHPFLVFGAQAYGNRHWLDTWASLDHAPRVGEVIRNLPVRHPLIWLTLSAGQSPVAPLWTDYLQARERGEIPFLPDFSYAGYHFSEKDLPDLAGRTFFDVTRYGAIPDDQGYDDQAIQKAIDAAEANPGGGVVFFPPGTFRISPDSDPEKNIRISRSHIVLKGSGAGKGGTEIFQDSMRIGTRQFHFRPDSLTGKMLTTITADAMRETHWVEVADVSGLREGQDVVIRHQSEAYTRLYFDPLPLAPEWTRLFGSGGGMNIREIHTIERIEGNRVKFRNPIHLDIKLVPGDDFALYSYVYLEECGIEDMLFTSNWGNYPESFVHHKNAIHDSGWCAVSMENLKDSWIRDCEFRDLNESVFMRSAYRVSVRNVVFSGKKGHSTVHARSGYGVLIEDCRFESETHHGPGTGYGGVGTVVTGCVMQTDQNIDSHSGQPYATLFDNVQGGIFRNIGGPLPGLPHHGKYLVFWNFFHSSTDDFHYKFWDVKKRRNHTFARPVFVGFRADRRITFEDEGVNQLPDTEVAPRSLFDAQLSDRLQRERSDH